MASKRNTLTIRVPEDLKNRIEKVSALQGVSINQFALYAFTREIAELENQSFFDAVVGKIDKRQLLKAVDDVLASIPERAVPDWDQMPTS